MGEAKRRGTFEERKAQALARPSFTRATAQSISRRGKSVLNKLLIMGAVATAAFPLK